MQPKKSNKKLIVGIVAIVVILAIILILFFFVFSSPLIGTWEQESGSYSSRIKINGDGSFEVSSNAMGQWTLYIKIGTWSTNGNQLCFAISESSYYSMGMTVGKTCGTYSISGNTLTLESNGSSATWTKI